MKKLAGKLSIVIVIVGLGLMANNAFSQPTGSGPPGPPPGGDDPPCWPPPCIPVDGGIGFLIAGGLLIGGKKAYDLMKS